MGEWAKAAATRAVDVGDRAPLSPCPCCPCPRIDDTGELMDHSRFGDVTDELLEACSPVEPLICRRKGEPHEVSSRPFEKANAPPRAEPRMA